MFDTTRTLGRWPSILSALGVDETTLSRRNCPCPFCGGKDRFRFTDQDGAGVWVCNACGSGNGYHFVQKWKGVTFRKACELIEAVLPQASLSIAPKMVDKREKLNRMWRQAAYVQDGDPVALYLRRRGLLQHSVPPKDIKHAAGVSYWLDGRREGTYHAMLAMVRDGKSNASTIHVTYLTEAGEKANVPAPKKVMSAMGDGAHVELNVPDGNVLLLTEGIETGMAVMDERSGTTTWAMISAGGLGKFVRPEWATRIEIYGDNDANFTGQGVAYSLAHKLSMAGVDVAVHIPASTDTDWADVFAGVES
jgi:putative DNA primase/helicase